MGRFLPVSRSQPWIRPSKTRYRFPCYFPIKYHTVTGFIKKSLVIKDLPITIAKVFVILSSSDANFAKI